MTCGGPEMLREAVSRPPAPSSELVHPHLAAIALPPTTLPALIPPQAQVHTRPPARRAWPPLSPNRLPRGPGSSAYPLPPQATLTVSRTILIQLATPPNPLPSLAATAASAVLSLSLPATIPVLLFAPKSRALRHDSGPPLARPLGRRRCRP